MKYGLGPQYFLFFAFAASLVIISFIDLHHQIIPDIISLPGILLGLGISFFLNHVYWLDSLIGIVGGGGFLFLVAFIFERLTGKEGMGGGDVKLLAMIGAWLGWQALPLIILISSLAGTVIGGGALMLTGKGYRVKIPFGPFLAISALISLLFGNELTHWYYNLWRS
jgi:leader peptidase (prepilin peptidase)/N-methyltransferase